ncbi:hypothetical protein M404DRAFT_1003553 [Pisolithus tinctorius Marx 270]|uniref:Uncharacterized protein n=1 Tax=Pisolithus tinctorius Marx 270 TaxID=870435 RepID=A0A0C3IVK3_PISTI|nr:hypothetical protein M404DRAFT_1003553 [Pisolithus tinctorius Marx 270]
MEMDYVKDLQLIVESNGYAARRFNFGPISQYRRYPSFEHGIPVYLWRSNSVHSDST